MTPLSWMTPLVAAMTVTMASALTPEVPNMEAWASLAVQPFDAVHDAGALLNRSRRQTDGDLSLAIPNGAVLAISPRFGWLLYQAEDDEEELDLVFESEFLYRFPKEEEEEEEEEAAEEAEHGRRGYGRHVNYRHTHSPYDAVSREVAGPTEFILHAHRSKRMVHHRNKRMVRDKKMVYKGLENVFTIMGMDGRSCLLRAICEVTATPLVYDGVVGELLNLALVPRHTNGHHEDLAVYLEAEEHGKLGNDCGVTYSSCPISLFNMVAPGSVQFDS